MTRAEQRLRKIRRLERELDRTIRDRNHWYMVAYAGYETVRQIRIKTQHLERRLKNGKQRDRR